MAVLLASFVADLKSLVQGGAGSNLPGPDTESFLPIVFLVWALLIIKCREYRK